MKIDYEAVHLKSSWHEADILNSKVCGCFFCLAIYPPSEIDAECWAEESPNESKGPGKTVFCPKCGIDSVLPDNIGYELTPEFLKSMKAYYFYPED